MSMAEARLSESTLATQSDPRLAPYSLKGLGLSPFWPESFVAPQDIQISSQVARLTSAGVITSPALRACLVE